MGHARTPDPSGPGQVRGGRARPYRVNILAFHTGRDASAALLCDGRLALAVAEEKFDNVKGSSGPPRRSVAWLLEESGLGTDDIDVVAHAGAVSPERLIAGHSPDETLRASRLRRAYEAAEYRLFRTPAGRAMAATRRRR